MWRQGYRLCRVYGTLRNFVFTLNETRIHIGILEHNVMFCFTIISLASVLRTGYIEKAKVKAGKLIRRLVKKLRREICTYYKLDHNGTELTFKQKFKKICQMLLVANNWNSAL